MYRCKDCGEFFEEPIIYHDDPSPAGVALPSGHYTYWQCPHCGGEDVEEAGECRSCGEPVESGRVLCDDCQCELMYFLKDMAKDMHLTEDDLEDAIGEHYYW